MWPPGTESRHFGLALLRKLLTFSEMSFISVGSTPFVTEMHREGSRPKRLGLFIALPLIGVALLAAACGGGSTKTSSSASSSTTAPAGSTAAASRAKFTQCLESHGVPASVASAGFGRRGTGGSTSSTTTGGGAAGRSSLFTQYQSAFNACRSDLPSGAGRPGNFNSAAFAAYRNCLEIHGVTVPTTTPGSSGSGGFSGGLGAATQSPAFQAAQKACTSLLPARSGSTTTAPPAAS
jgi:hypothetical protein